MKWKGISQIRRLVRKELTEEEWNEIGEGISFETLQDIKFLVQCVIDVFDEGVLSLEEAFKELAPPPKSPGHELFWAILAETDYDVQNRLADALACLFSPEVGENVKRIEGYDELDANDYEIDNCDLEDFINGATFDEAMALVTQIIKAKMPNALGIGVLTDDDEVRRLDTQRPIVRLKRVG